MTSMPNLSQRHFQNRSPSPMTPTPSATAATTWSPSPVSAVAHHTPSSGPWHPPPPSHSGSAPPLPPKLTHAHTMPLDRLNTLHAQHSNLAGPGAQHHSQTPIGLPPPPLLHAHTAPISTNANAALPALPPRPQPATSAPDQEKTLWQSALSETKHFASGLIPHPTESNKYYTIVRHSAPLIFYRGPATSVAISVLSRPDHPLPPDRSLWLQQRGFSGDSGMKIKAMMGGMATESWVNVTPSVRVGAERLVPETERGWQRDIGKVARKSAKDKGDAKGHIPRETLVVRIPERCDDGYFRLVLCTGGYPKPDGSVSKRKILCPSPIFRVASTSSDSSVFRGASLSTLPLEVGVKVASVVVTNVIERYTGPVVGAAMAVAERIPKPGTLVTEAALLGASAVSAHMASRNEEQEASMVPDYVKYQTPGVFMNGMMGLDSGPQPPYPLKFSGKVVIGTGRSGAEMGMPTANLTKVTPDSVLHNLKGLYFGWACVTQGNDAKAPKNWHEAIITASPNPYGRASVVEETEITVHMIHDFGGGSVSFFDCKMKVIVMGYLRPILFDASSPSSLPQRMEMASQDVRVTLASLNSSRENWGPDETVHKLRKAKSERGLGERFTDARDRVQRQIDKVPMHWVGIRSGDAELRDRVHGNGGYWVPR